MSCRCRFRCRLRGGETERKVENREGHCTPNEHFPNSTHYWFLVMPLFVCDVRVVAAHFHGAAVLLGAVTLGFRLFMSITPLLVNVQYPNVSPFVHSVLSVLMFCLLMHHRPYVVIHTFWIHVSCYKCLIAQFVLQAITSTRDALDRLRQASFFSTLEACSVAIR